jgi:hypothetical protein
MAQRARPVSSRKFDITPNAPRGDHNMTTKLIKSILIGALFPAVCAQAADNTIVIAQEDGSQVAAFKLNGSVCTLKNDQIRCAPVSK